MHSVYQRINLSSALLSSCFFALLALIALSSFAHDASPTGELAIKSFRVNVGTVLYTSHKQHTAHLNFEYDADLTPLFHWNTKQLFLYLSAEYTNKRGSVNDVVFWDKIVRRKQDADLHIRARNKYPFKDIDRSFSNSTSVVFSMKYNVMPWIGTLRYGVAGVSKPIPFPEPETKL